MTNNNTHTHIYIYILCVYICINMKMVKEKKKREGYKVTLRLFTIMGLVALGDLRTMLEYLNLICNCEK